jgi:dsDNA-binding SOS-regulon protein
MGVEVRYHVIRDGKEVAMYTSKKEADEHDKMLDIADRLSEFIESAQGLNLDENMLEELSIHLSRNRLDVIQILKGGKPRQTQKTVDAQPNEKIAKAGSLKTANRPVKSKKARPAAEN